jgi:hypothetical protein
VGAGVGIGVGTGVGAGVADGARTTIVIVAMPDQASPSDTW